AAPRAGPAPRRLPPPPPSTRSWPRSHDHRKLASRCENPPVLVSDRPPGLASTQDRIAGSGRVRRRGNPAKERSVSRASITKAHNKIQELSWEPTYVSPVEKY